MIRIILFMILGVSLGSFFNVIIMRLDTGQSFIKGRSKCDSCQKYIKWYDLIPIISYIILRGKCRYCKSKISYNHIFSEIILGLGLAVITALDLSIYDKLIGYITVISLGFNAIMDLNKHQMEAISNYLAIAVIAVMRIIQYWNTPILTIYIVMYILLYLIFISTYLCFEEKIGFGDFESLMLVIISVGFLSGIYVVFYMSIVSMLIVVPLLMSKKVDFKKALPLLPFMYLGYLVHLLI